VSSTITVPQTELSVILDEIEERANKSTEGPWDWHGQSRTFAVSHVTKGVHQPRVINGDTDYDEAEKWKTSCGGVVEMNDARFIASARTDVPALVKALRRACERIGHISDLYCGVNDMTGRNALEEISVILNQGRKNLHLSENGTRSDSGSEFPKSVSGRSQ
jgi:hypothetical protein